MVGNGMTGRRHLPAVAETIEQLYTPVSISNVHIFTTRLHHSDAQKSLL